MLTDPTSPQGNGRPITDAELDAALAHLLSASRSQPSNLGDLRSSVLTRIGSSPPTGPVTAPRHLVGPVVMMASPARTRPQSRVRPLLLAAIIALLVAGGIIVPSVISGRGGGNASAVAALDAAADAAGDRASSGADLIPAGKYRYIDYRYWTATMGEFVYLTEGRVQRWIPSDPVDVWMERRSTTGQRRWIIGSESDAAALGLPPAGAGTVAPDLTGPCQDYAQNVCIGAGSWSFPTEQWIADLPTDPESLYARLCQDAAGASGPVESQMLLKATEALSSGILPANTRATLYRAIAMIPGIEITDGTANLDTRTGTAFALDSPNFRDETIIDTGTGEFIGTRTTVLANDDVVKIPPGTVTEYTAILASIVDERGLTQP